MNCIKGCFSSCCNKITKYYEPEIIKNGTNNNNIDENNKEDNIKKDENKNINENKDDKKKEIKEIKEENEKEKEKEITDSKKEEENNEENENINENKDDKDKDKEAIIKEGKIINKEEIKSKNNKEEDIKEEEDSKEDENESKEGDNKDNLKENIDENENSEQHYDIDNQSFETMLNGLNLPMPNVNNNNNNNNNDKEQQLINDLHNQCDKKSKNEDVNKKVEKNNLKLKPKNIDKIKHYDSNKLKLLQSQKKYTGNKKFQPKPSQTFEDIKKTDMRLHNFLTRIVIKICKLEELFCEKNKGNCSKFWKNLVGDNKKTFKTNDNLFTKVLNRNYNHHNICDNNHTLQLLDKNITDIKGTPKTSEIIKQMVQQQNCEQLERLLRISNEDKNKLENLKPQRQYSLGSRTLQDPMTPLISSTPINKSTEIMLMLSAIQDAAFDIYKEESKEKEKQHAKNILLFFRQVLTTLYKKKIISVNNPKCKLGTVPVEEEKERKEYWQQLNKQQQWKTVENKYVDFTLEDNVTDIEKIDLTKLFWKNGKQFDGKNFHHIPAEMACHQQCIDEQAKFKLDNSVVLDDEKNL